MRPVPAAAALACAAAVGLAPPALAFVRTADRVTGAELSWPVPVVAWHLSSAPAVLAPSCAGGGADLPLVEAMRASFAEWEQGCAGLELVYGGRIDEIRIGLSGTGENLVVVRQGWCSADPEASGDPCMTDPDVDCGGIYDCFEDHGPADRSTVALTTVLYDPETGRIFDADLEVNGWDGTGDGTALTNATSSAPRGFYFTCADPAGLPACTRYGEDGCYAFDLRNTVTHEAGHFVGLAHPCGDAGTPQCDALLPPGETVAYAQRTMYPATAAGETTKRSLSLDDVAGVCAIYPPDGGCGCGAGGAPGALAALLAALALRPRLTRRQGPRTRRPVAGPR